MLVPWKLIATEDSNYSQADVINTLNLKFEALILKVWCIYFIVYLQDPEPMAIMSELGVTTKCMDTLLNIDGDYWSGYIDVDGDQLYDKVPIYIYYSLF